MYVSVIICTYNRSKLLKRTIKSLLYQQDIEDYEIVIIDNFSNHDTQQMVYEFTQGKYSFKLKYIIEDHIGLSYARNRGIKESSGDIIVFIDDDAKADKFWLTKLIAVYKEEENVGCVGGKVVLDWLSQRPSWWVPGLEASFSAVDYGPKRKRVSYPQYPYGTNISYRREAIEKVGLFDTELGRTGSKLLAGEEIDLCLRIEKAGYNIFYEPEAIVYHAVDPDRLNKIYIRKRAYWHGRSMAVMELRYFKHAYVSKKMIRLLYGICKDILNIRNLFVQSLLIFKIGYIIEGIKQSIKFKNALIG